MIVSVSRYILSAVALLALAAPCATAPARTIVSKDVATSPFPGTHTGDVTFYATGLGACGITNSDSDLIAAVSHLLFDSYPGYNGVNPNDNPVCGQKLTANYQGKSVTVTVVDRCVGCSGVFDLDFSPGAFSDLASESLGRLSGVTWSFD